MSASTTCTVCRVENGLHNCCCGNKNGVSLSDLRAHLNRNFNTCAARDGHVLVHGLVDGSRAGMQLTCSYRHCNETFKTNDELQRHVLEVHVGSTEGKIYCQDCKQYKSQSNWAKHLALHREQGPQIRGTGPAFATQKKRAHASARAAVAADDERPRKRTTAAAAAAVAGDEVGGAGGDGNYEVGGFDVGSEGDGDGARQLLDVVALPRGEQQVRAVIMAGATVPVGAPSDIGAGYLLGPTPRNPFVPSVGARPADKSGGGPSAEANNNGNNSDDELEEGARGGADGGDDGGGGGGGDDDDDDDDDDDNDDDMQPEPDASRDAVRRAQLQVLVPKARPVEGVVFSVVDVADFMAHEPAAGRRGGTQAVTRAGDDVDALRRTCELYALLLNAGASRRAREEILGYVSNELSVAGQVAVLPTEHLALQAIKLATPVPVAKKLVLNKLDGSAGSLAYFDMAELAAIVAERAFNESGGAAAAFRTPSDDELRQGQAALKMFYDGFDLANMPPMPASLWASACYAYQVERFGDALRAAPSFPLLTLVQITADETRAAGRKLMMTRVRFLWDPHLRWHEVVTFDPKEYDRHFVWSSCLLPGLDRLQHGLTVRCRGGRELCLAGDLVAVLGDKEFFWGLLALSEKFASVHCPASRKSPDWTKLGVCSADVIARGHGAADSAAPSAAWRSLSALCHGFDRAQEAHAAARASRSEQLVVINELAELGVKAVEMSLVGTVSVAPDDGSQLAAAVRNGAPVLQRSFLFDCRLEAARDVGSLLLPNCSLHQHHQGLVEHLLKKIAFSIGIDDALAISRLV